MLYKQMLAYLSLLSVSLLTLSSLYSYDGYDSDAHLNAELQNSPYIPFNIGADDTEGPDELDRMNHPYDPNPYYYNLNEGYEEG